MKILFLVLLISLACIGVGVAGGIPIPTSANRTYHAETAIEQIDEKEEDDVCDVNLKG